MQEVTRRRALRIGAIAAGVTVAGCTAVDAWRASDSAVGSLLVNNHDDAERRVHTLLVADGEPVSLETVTVASRDTTPDRVPHAFVDGHPTDAGPYVLHAWHDDMAASDAASFDLRAYDEPEAQLTIRIGSPFQGRTGEVRIWAAD